MEGLPVLHSFPSKWAIFQSYLSLRQLFWFNINSFNPQGVTRTFVCANNSDLSSNLFTVMPVGVVRSIAVRSVHSSARPGTWLSPVCLSLLSSVTWNGGEEELVGYHAVTFCENLFPAQAAALHSFSEPPGTWEFSNGSEPYTVIAGFL